MIIQFQKMGEVRVGTSEPGQDINLLNPIGTPHEVSVNLIEETITMVIQAEDEDGRNSVVRTYTKKIPTSMIINFLSGFFTTDVRPFMKENYNEFKDLIDLGIKQ